MLHFFVNTFLGTTLSKIKKWKYVSLDLLDRIQAGDDGRRRVCFNPFMFILFCVMLQPRQHTEKCNKGPILVSVSGR